MELGEIATEFVARSYADELLAELQQFVFLGSSSGLEIYGTGQVAATTRALAAYLFQVEMIAPPTISSPSWPNWAFYNQNVTAFVAWTTPSQQVSKYGFLFDISGMAASLGGAGDAAMWGPNATAAAQMAFDARLL